MAAISHEDHFSMPAFGGISNKIGEGKKLRQKRSFFS